jgi:hypothetical protein
MNSREVPVRSERWRRAHGICVYTHSANGKIFYVGQGNSRRPYERGVEAEQIESEMIAGLRALL